MSDVTHNNNDRGWQPLFWSSVDGGGYIGKGRGIGSPGTGNNNVNPVMNCGNIE